MTLEEAEACVRKYVAEWRAECPSRSRFDIYDFALWMHRKHSGRCFNLNVKDPFRVISTWGEEEMAQWIG